MLLHASSLCGEFRCGCFGKGALDFIDFLSYCGFSYWQVLPFGHPDLYYSPYAPLSAFGGNILFIDPESLFREDLITKNELALLKIKDSEYCRFEEAKKIYIPILKNAVKKLKVSSVESFIKANRGLKEYCMFMAYREMRQKGSPKSFEENLFFHQATQYLFHNQWKKVKTYAKKKSIEIIGDVPFYVSEESSDVMMHPEQFLLDHNQKANLVAGVPPDLFSPTGQLWGNPVYNWEQMKKDGYSWWKARLEYNLSLFDSLRIDHFRAISDYYAIPSGNETAIDGKWYSGPGDNFIEVIKSSAKSKKIIAENLGHLDENAVNLLQRSGFAGINVIQFAFDGNRDNPHLPENYSENSVVYSGTHDNDTLLGFLTKLDNYTLKHVLDYVGLRRTDLNKCIDLIIESLYQSKADTVILPMQDILHKDSRYRMNTPGTVKNNWIYKLTEKDLYSVDIKKYQELNKRQ